MSPLDFHSNYACDSRDLPKQTPRYFHRVTKQTVVENISIRVIKMILDRLLVYPFIPTRTHINVIEIQRVDSSVCVLTETLLPIYINKHEFCTTSPSALPKYKGTNQMIKCYTTHPQVLYVGIHSNCVIPLGTLT